MNSHHPTRDQFARAILLAGLVVATLISAPLAHGQTDIFKAGNATVLSSNLSWTLSTGGAGGNPAAVNAGDLAIIDGTVNATIASGLSFSSNLALGELKITNPGGPVTINSTAALNLTLGNGAFTNIALVSAGLYGDNFAVVGLDLSGVTNSSVGLTIGSNVTTVLGATQIWQVGNGTSTPTVSVNGPLSMGSQQLYLQGSGNFNLAGNISGSALLSLNTTGTTTLSGTNTNSGGVVLGNGTLILTNGGTGTESSLGTGTFGIDTYYYSGATTLTTANTTVNIGTNNAILLYGNLNFIDGTGANLNLGTGAVSLGTNITANITGNSLTLGGVISDGGITNSDAFGITKTGIGTLVLAGANTFTGNLNMTAGILSLTNNLALQDAILNYTGGTLTLTAGSQLALGGLAGTQNIALGTGNLDITTVYGHDATYTGNLTGGNTTSAVTINGAAVQAFSGFSIYTGNTTLNSGTLAINGGGNATNGTGPIGANTSKLVINGGSLDNTSGSNVTLLTNNAQLWDGNFTFAGTGNLNLGTGAVTMNASRTVTVSANTLTVGGIISGTGFSLTKNGTYGTLVLAGANTYTGGTTVNAGTLDLTGANNFVGGTLTVNSGGILSLNGSNTMTGNTNLNSGGQLNFNNAGAIGTGTLVINGGTLDNTSGSDITTSSHNNTQQWNGGFTFAGSNALNLGTGAVSMTTSIALNVDNTTLTVGGIISGTGFGLTQSGNGTLVLAGANTYTGATTVDSGTLTLSGNNHAATGNVLVNSGGQLNFNNVQAVGSGATLTLNGGSTLDNTSGGTITNANNNALQVNGTVNYIGSNALSYGTGGVALQSNSTLNVEASTLTLGGTVSGVTFGLTKNGTGTLVLSGTNSYSGYTDINGGTLSVSVLANGGSNSGIGSSSNAATNLVIANNGTLQYTGGTVSTDRLFTIGNFTATIDASGTGNLTFSNTGNINFNPAGTSDGTVSGNASFVDADVTDTLILTGADTGRNTMDPGIGNNPNSTLATSVIKNGTGEWVLAGNNTYSGQTILNTGTLALAGQSANATVSALGTSTLVINGGTLDNTSGAALTLGTNNAILVNNGFTFAGTGALNTGLGAVTLTNGTAATITTTASTLTIGGVIGDNGLGYSLTKGGTAGTLVLNGVNTFSGNMNVTGGTLVLGSATALENSILNDTSATANQVTFAAGGAVTLGGLAGTVSANTTAEAYTINMSRNSVASYAGVISGTSSLTISGQGTETLSGIQTYTGGTTVNGGTLVLTGANTNASGTVTVAGGTLDYNSTKALGATAVVLKITGGNIDNTSGGAIVSANNNTQQWDGNFTFVGSNALNLGTGAVALNATHTVTILANTLTVGGVISGATFGLTLNGAGTLDLDPTAAKASTYTGATTINGGTLEVDFTKAAKGTTNLLSTSSALGLGGGTLELLGFGATDTNSQTFASTTINSGASTITPNDNGGTSTTVALQAITRNAGGTLNISNAFTSANLATTTSTTHVENGIITSGVGAGVAYLTVNGTDWGAISVSDIIALATYTSGTTNTNWTTTHNMQVTATPGGSIAAASIINSLQFNNTGTAGTVTLLGNLTINTGGILDSSADTQANTITGGNIMGLNTATDELVVIQNSAANLTIASNIINETGNATSLTKSGTGELILSGANTYNGTTTLNQGTLGLGSTTALGNASATLVINGGSLDNTSGGALTLANNNAQDWDDNFTFVGSQALSMGTGLVTLGQNITLTTTASTLTVGGNITGSGMSLTKAGAGELVLSGAGSNYTGGTILSAGTLAINNGGNATASAIGTGALTITGGSLDNTSGANVTLGTNNALNLDGNFTYAGTGNLNTGTGATSLGQNETITVAANTLTVGGNISGGYTLLKAGTGDLVLTGNSTYTGGTNITAGTVEANSTNALGTGGSFNTVTVANGATLQLDQGFDSGDAGSSAGSMLSLNGVGVGGNGALLASGSGATEWAGNITLAGNALVSAGTTANSILDLGTNNQNEPGTTNISLGANTLTFTGGANTNITVNSFITGSGGINVNMTSNATNSANNGVVDFAQWTNSYTGTTQVTNGTLIVDTQTNTVPLTTSPGNLTAINGPVIIGTGVNSANTAILQISNPNDSLNPSIANPFASTANVTINSDGQLFLDHGATQTITNLTMTNGGYINTFSSISGNNYSGLLTVLGTTTINGNGTSTSFIDGNLSMSNPVGNETNIFNVSDGLGGTTSDLTVNALVSGGSMLKTGNGTMTLTNGNNSYSGTTEIAAGTLAITAGSTSSNSTTATSPLGESSGNASANGTIVDNGGQLQLQNNITINGEGLTINGNGTNNNGALNNASGNNTWNGSVIVGAQNATINTSGGNLTIAGNITSASSTPTLTMVGNNTTTTISGEVNGAVTLNITGGPGSATNTVQMTGTLGNSYTGNTNINENSTLVLNRTAGLNSVINGGTITINQGGTLLSDTSEQINIGTNMNLNGGTWATNGSSAPTWTEALATLTLSMSSNIDLGANSNKITFLASNGNTWSPGANLYINGWNGIFSTSITGSDGNNGGGGQDQISFSSQTGLSGTSFTGQLGDIIFVNPEWNGVQYTGDFNAVILSDGEVVPFLPAPEPGTVAAGAALATLALMREWRRRKSRTKAV